MCETATNLRQWRLDRKLSLDAVCDLLHQQGLDRPSAAKLSRIERKQKVPASLLPALVKITGIPAKEMRPDLAEQYEKLFADEAAE